MRLWRGIMWPRGVVWTAPAGCSYVAWGLGPECKHMGAMAHGRVRGCGAWHDQRPWWEEHPPAVTACHGAWPWGLAQGT